MHMDFMLVEQIM